MPKFSALIMFVVAMCANCFGQSLSCVANGAVNPPIRAEGLTEQLGDFVVTCVGGTPTALGAPVPTVDIQIYVNTFVTSKLLGGAWSEALLMIDDPAPGAQRICGTTGDTESSPGVCTITGTGTGAGVYSGGAGRPNVFQGQVFTNVVIFTGIPVDPPGNLPGAQRIFRVTNLRANANYLGVSVGNNPPTSITETIVAIPFNRMPISGLADQAAGSIQQGMSTSVSPVIAFPQNFSQNAALAADPNSSGVSQFNVRFRELFSTAFKKRNIATSAAAPTALANQNDLTIGSFYNTESGIFNSSFPIVVNRGNLGLAGLADTGARLMARFAQVPPGVLLFSQTSGVVSGPGSFNPPDVVRMVSTDVNGAGPYSPVVGNAFGIAPIPVVNGFATAFTRSSNPIPTLSPSWTFPFMSPTHPISA